MSSEGPTPEQAPRAGDGLPSSPHRRAAGYLLRAVLFVVAAVLAIEFALSMVYSWFGFDPMGFVIALLGAAILESAGYYAARAVLRERGDLGAVRSALRRHRRRIGLLSAGIVAADVPVVGGLLVFVILPGLLQSTYYVDCRTTTPAPDANVTTYGDLPRDQQRIVANATATRGGVRIDGADAFPRQRTVTYDGTAYVCNRFHDE